MKKRHFVLVLGLLAVMMISNLEDYISSPEFSFGEQDYETIDYYLNDFSLSAIKADGKVSHTMDGQYLAYWQNKDSSFIVRPRLVSKDDNDTGQQVDSVVITSQEAILDHKTEIAALTGVVELRISNNGENQLSLDTSELNYNLKDKHISTEENVSIISPHIQLTGTGLDTKLDDTTLRLNANVKSTYEPH